MFNQMLAIMVVLNNQSYTAQLGTKECKGLRYRKPAAACSQTGHHIKHQNRKQFSTSWLTLYKLYGRNVIWMGVDKHGHMVAANWMPEHRKPKQHHSEQNGKAGSLLDGLFGDGIVCPTSLLRPAATTNATRRTTLMANIAALRLFLRFPWDSSQVFCTSNNPNHGRLLTSPRWSSHGCSRHLGPVPAALLADLHGAPWRRDGTFSWAPDWCEALRQWLVNSSGSGADC